MHSIGVVVVRDTCTSLTRQWGWNWKNKKIVFWPCSSCSLMPNLSRLAAQMAELWVKAQLWGRAVVLYGHPITKYQLLSLSFHFRMLIAPNHVPNGAPPAARAGPGQSARPRRAFGATPVKTAAHSTFHPKSKSTPFLQNTFFLKGTYLLNQPLC